MIVFDLDGTLANIDHRRHFVDPEKNPDFLPIYAQPFDYINPKTGEIFKPDWKSFYEACDKDDPNLPVIHTLESLAEGAEYGSDTPPWIYYKNIEIWSSRCESVRKKTEIWLNKNLKHYLSGSPILKMRPIGNTQPDDELKEFWLLDAIILEGKTIDYVFDDRPKVIRMWRRRGIFVFSCCQQHEEF